MKHITISYIFYILQLGGSSLCWGLPQQSNQKINNEQHLSIINETTTAEPKWGFSSSTINDLLNATTSEITTKKTKIIESTTPLYGNNGNTKSIHYSQSVESTTKGSYHSTRTTTAIPITVSPSLDTHHFDLLNFIGGSLFTFCLIAVGVALWKIYKVRVERNYCTI